MYREGTDGYEWMKSRIVDGIRPDEQVEKPNRLHQGYD